MDIVAIFLCVIKTHQHNYTSHRHQHSITHYRLNGENDTQAHNIPTTPPPPLTNNRKNFNSMAKLQCAH